MTKGEKHIVVLRDDAGQTYLLDDQTLQQSRVQDSGAVDEVLKDSQLDHVTGGAFRLVGSFNLQQAGGLSIAQRLRAI